MTLPIIYGFNKTSEVGNNVFTPAIFLDGCNFRCPYCMNARLVTREAKTEINIDEVKQYVEEYQSEWFMISGGEPTCHSSSKLISLLEKIKSWGCKVSMSTNGSNTHTLRCIIDYLNYIAMDIKSSNKNGYEMLAGFESAFDRVLSSLKLLREIKESRKDFDFELRTTLYPSVINNNVISEIGSTIIHKDDKWMLQQFRPSLHMLDEHCRDIKPYSDEELKDLLNVAKQFCNNVSIRYV